MRSESPLSESQATRVLNIATTSDSYSRFQCFSLRPRGYCAIASFDSAKFRSRDGYFLLKRLSSRANSDRAIKFMPPIRLERIVFSYRELVRPVEYVIVMQIFFFFSYRPRCIFMSQSA